MTDYLNNFPLEGEVALITGAFYGVGFAIVKTMAGTGTTIAFNDVKQELVDKGLAAYKEEGIEVHGYVYDVTSEDAVNKMVGKIEKKASVVDILVNNTGIVKRTLMCDMTAAESRQVTGMDLNAPFIVSKIVIPSMTRRSHRKIINICSMTSRLDRETVSVYATVKGDLKVLAKNVAPEYGEYNIQYNSIGPGYIATPQTTSLREIQLDSSRHLFDQFIVSKTPAGCRGEAEDLGGPTVFLTPDVSNFVNELVLHVNGEILVYIGRQPR